MRVRCEQCGRENCYQDPGDRCRCGKGAMHYMSLPPHPFFRVLGALLARFRMNKMKT